MIRSVTSATISLLALITLLHRERVHAVRREGLRVETCPHPTELM